MRELEKYINDIIDNKYIEMRKKINILDENYRENLNINLSNIISVKTIPSNYGDFITFALDNNNTMYIYHDYFFSLNIENFDKTKSYYCFIDRKGESAVYGYFLNIQNSYVSIIPIYYNTAGIDIVVNLYNDRDNYIIGDDIFKNIFNMKR